MDGLRNGYRKPMRFWLDDDTTVMVRWFRTEPNAKVFTDPSYFRSSLWEKYSWVTPVGETKSDPLVHDRGLDTVGYWGDHYCGRQAAIQYGGVHGIDSPITTNADGSCDCCDTANQTEANGIGVGINAIQGATAIQWGGYAPNGLQGGEVVSTPVGCGVGSVGSQGRLYLSGSSLSYGLDPYGASFLTPYLPSLAITYLTDVMGVGTGTLFDQEGSIVYIGELREFAFNATPSFWLNCDGSYVSQSTYAALYALLGSTWGPTIGGNFALPNLQRKVTVGNGGTASGVLGNSIGNTGGAEAVTLTSSESGMPSHDHAAKQGAFAETFGVQIVAVGGSPFLLVQASDANTAMAAAANAAAAHNNIQPTAVVKRMIYAGV